MRIWSTSFCFAFLLVQPLKAQEHPAEEPLDEVSVTAQQEDPRRYDNASKSTVSHKELTKYGDTSLQDAVRRIPGVTFDGTQIRFRGLGSGYTQILINGDPAPLGFTLDSLSPDAVERIEIYKTPVANISTQSIAGSLNIVLREKTKDRHLSAKAGVVYNQGNKSPSMTLEGSENFSRFSFQIIGNASKAVQSQSSTIDEFDYDAERALTTQYAISEASDIQRITYNLTPILTWKGSNDKVNWQLFIQQFETPFRFDLNEQTLVGSPSDYPYSLSQSRHTTRNLYKSNLAWTHDFSANQSLQSRINLSYQSRHSNFYFDGYDADGVFALDRNIASTSFDRILVSKEKYVQQINDEHSFEFGWDGSITQRSETRFQIDRAPPEEDIVDTLDQIYDARVLKKAIYAQDSWTMSKSLDIYLGVRVELTDVRVSGPDFAAVGNDSSIVSPIAQVIWKMPYNSKDQIRIGISQTSRAPDTANLVPRRYTVNVDNGPANPDSQGNPYLRPERSWGLDAGYESYLSGDGILDLSVYIRHIDDVMIPILFLDGTEWVTSTENSGTATSYGTEAEFKIPLQQILRVSPKLEIKGDLSANWSSVKDVPDPKNRLADQTPLSATWGLEYDTTGALSAGASFRFTSGYTSKATPLLSNYSSSTQSFDIYGLWQINKRSRVRLVFENLFHRNEIVGSLYSDPNESSNRFTTGDEGDKVKLSFEIGL